MAHSHISTTKWELLREFMRRMDLKEDDLVEKFILGSGKGGQKLNKTSSCVYLKHKPSGFETKCQLGRSREMNRYLARRELCERIEEKTLGERSRRRQAMERIRRQKQRRSRRAKENMLANKHHQSEKKQQRGRVTPGNEA